MTEQCLNMTKTQASFKKMSGKAVAKGVYMDFFLIPHSSTTVFMAFCAPPLSIWVVAFWIVLRLPFALGEYKIWMTMPSPEFTQCLQGQIR